MILKDSNEFSNQSNKSTSSFVMTHREKHSSMHPNNPHLAAPRDENRPSSFPIVSRPPSTSLFPSRLLCRTEADFKTFHFDIFGSFLGCRLGTPSWRIGESEGARSGQSKYSSSPMSTKSQGSPTLLWFCLRPGGGFSDAVSKAQ